MLTFAQTQTALPWVTGDNDAQADGGFISGYALVFGRRVETVRNLASLLWGRRVPAYTAVEADGLAQVVQTHGAPRLLLLHPEDMDAGAVVELEEFRVGHNVPLLCVVTGEPREPWLHALLRMADDFVVTPFEPFELLLRLRRVCRSPFQTGGPSASSHAVRPDGPDPAPTFSVIERRILDRLRDNVGEPVALEELCSLLSGGSPEANLKLLRVHIFRLRRKIEPAPKNPIYLRTVRDYGYYLTQRLDGLGES